MAPTPLSIDAPPPVPTVSPYPDGIKALYYPGYAIETSSPMFDSRKPMKVWSRPVQPGENPASVIVFGYFDASLDYVSDELFMTKADAAATNIAPPILSAATLAGTVYQTQFIPVPARPLLSTETITHFGTTVTNSAIVLAVPQSAQQTTDSATLQRILAGVQALLKVNALPPV